MGSKYIDKHELGILLIDVLAIGSSLRCFENADITVLNFMIQKLSSYTVAEIHHNIKIQYNL